jgi:competence protein ComEA
MLLPGRAGLRDEFGRHPECRAAAPPAATLPVGRGIHLTKDGDMHMQPIRKIVGTLLLGYALAGACAERPIDINTADATTLAEVMVGIGPAKAAAIVDYREQNGPFASVDDLSLIKGIGGATIDKNRDRLTATKKAP